MKHIKTSLLVLSLASTTVWFNAEHAHAGDLKGYICPTTPSTSVYIAPNCADLGAKGDGYKVRGTTGRTYIYLCTQVNATPQDKCPGYHWVTVGWDEIYSDVGSGASCTNQQVKDPHKYSYKGIYKNTCRGWDDRVDP